MQLTSDQVLDFLRKNKGLINQKFFADEIGYHYTSLHKAVEGIVVSKYGTKLGIPEKHLAKASKIIAKLRAS